MLNHQSLILALALLAPTVAGAGLDDPWSVLAGAPLKPARQLAARVDEKPCATALPATPLTAAEALDLALCNNPQTGEVWAAARAQAALVGVAQAAWLPDVALQATASRQQSDVRRFNQQGAALDVTWLLYDFGQRSATIENARQLLAAAAATQDATVQGLFLAVLQAYYTAQAAQAAVASATEAERAARESFAAADSRYRVGVATPADRLQAQTALSQATLNRMRAEGEARSARGTLVNTLGFSAGQPLTLAEPPPLPAGEGFQQDVETLIARARAARPDLRAAEAQLAAARAGVRQAQAQGRPTVTLGLGPGWQRVDGVESDSRSVGVTLRVPLFSGFETTYRVRAAEAQADQKAAQRDRLQNQVALDVWKAYQALGTAGESLKATADLVASAEQSERVALGRYKAGVGTVLDLLAAQSALANARLQRIQSALDWHVARAALAQAVGQLNAGLVGGDGMRESE